MNGLPAQPGLWQEAHAADGRVYYYNTQTKATSWSKPADMLSPAERALAESPWKEYSANGRKYWHNAETKQTTWEMPDVLKNAQPQTPAQSHTPVQPIPARPAAPSFVAGGQYQVDSYRPHDRDDHGYDRQHNDRPYEGVRNTAMPTQTDNDHSPEEAESIFHKLLRRTGVQPDWSWEQAMKATVRDSQYRSIKDPKDRKAAFEKYIADVRAQEKGREKERQVKLRENFFQMLRSHPDEIKHYTRWKSARSIIEGETTFRAARSDDEAQALFNEFRTELLKAHNEGESDKRKSALDQLVHLLQSLDLEPYTRWTEAHKALQQNDRFRGDETFKSLNKIDVLKAFENHIKALERNFNDKRQKSKALKARQERQNRDKYMELLKDLRSAGKIKAGSKWTDIHDLIEDDPRYVAMLGQAGSTPLDLFWDVVEEEDRGLRSKRNNALDVLEDKRYELTQKTSFEDFLAVMQTDRRTATIDQDSMRQIFDRLREKVVRRSDEDRHSQRRAIDALRSKIKHLEPPVAAFDSWDSVRTRIEKSDEFRALDTDDLRRQAFDKHIRRLKERDAETTSDRQRSSRRDKDRRHRSRSPAEVDAYQADRLRAQADRERRGGRGSFGVTPPPARRRDDDRYEPARDRGDRYDGRESRRSTGHYDRERREREAERERTYLSRADPRDAGSSELDYGESKPTSTRRRRESEGEGRETKRVRSGGAGSSREHTFSPTASRRSRTPAKSKETDVAYKSGSEEGEIEEE
ncbi:hypothetical protein BT63DRAFT_389325 [Microthyrium microscopicum]|uniref:Formin binding protein-like protein n=1 Tax=Microthyrium microscopicum TaxID=703497 RepID=A0A6A6U5H0_9PEZI|nr:hypothetical protein BT63DRAFT_389325 [Microthyrium microscopicum]